MLVYRVFPHDPAARPNHSGHHSYLHKPQGRGRLDNPSHYDMWYFALSPEAAVGEVFGDLPIWSEDMLIMPPVLRRVLGVYEVADDLALLDLDDARNLLNRGLRPTQVIARNRPATQAWALNVFNERTDSGDRKWAGVKWWSFQRPHWTVFGIWVAPGEAPPHRFARLEALDVGHSAVQDAARSLGKTFR
ncbi:RES domain-containing protein [Arthrobacter zhaoguopingii]|uniref:RES domain-containing protein n=1 Tax=Arthrobacter zhaoguopingii TaxID=2681491 RepID=UPI00135B89EE|nr:RES domain-containing protein [Arthrobacter zhaoguopingii]